MFNHIVLSILFLTYSSGVLVCGVALVTEMCRVNPETLSHFRRVSECVNLSIVQWASTFVVECVQYSDVNLSQDSYRNWHFM